MTDELFLYLIHDGSGSDRHAACYNTDETCQVVGPRYTDEP